MFTKAENVEIIYGTKLIDCTFSHFLELFEFLFY